jgi:hypothetical protein
MGCASEVHLERANGEGGSPGSGVGGASTSAGGNGTIGVDTSNGSTQAAGGGPSPETCECSCAALAECGVSPPSCVEGCNDADVTGVACACAAPDCGSLVACFNKGEEDTSTLGIPSGEVPESCASCVNDVQSNSCASPHDECYYDEACLALLLCHQFCGWTAECNGSCDAQYPQGVSKLRDVMECSTCSLCVPDCIGSTLHAQYCD